MGNCLLYRYVYAPNVFKSPHSRFWGAAGIGIAHYLLKERHSVAAIDGVKINPIIGTSSGIKQTRFYVAQNKTTATINTQ